MEQEKYMFMAAIVIILILISYIYVKLNLKSANCKIINGYSQNVPTQFSQLSIVTSTKPNKAMFDVSLNRVFVKTAYNCCCTGNFKNDYVSLCALDNCFNQGVRALHFEIYSLNNKAIIATSSSNIAQTKYKEMYNQLDFYNTIKYIKTKFTTDNDDPLFLILEINSDIYNTYSSVYNTIYEFFGLNTVDGNQIMFFDYSSGNFGNVKLSTLIGKVVIMVKPINNDHFMKSGLKNITAVNLSFSNNYKMLKYNEFINTISSLSLNNEDAFKTTINEYKTKIDVLIPDKQSYSRNYDFISSGIMGGISFIALNYQFNDKQINNYNKIFSNAIGTGSFLLKNYVDKSDPNNFVYYSPSINAYTNKIESILNNKQQLIVTSEYVKLYTDIFG
jgi:hypothetical protein